MSGMGRFAQCASSCCTCLPPGGSADHISVLRTCAVDVKALDAAMPFDFEHKAQARLDKAKQLTIGIVGFGTFGQFLARRLVQAGHKVLPFMTCRSPSKWPRILTLLSCAAEHTLFYKK